MADLYKTVPRDYAKNLDWRVWARRRAEKDAGFRRAMLAACKQDVLFFFNGWCWLYEPRDINFRNGKALPRQIPFVVWDHQIPLIKQIDENLGKKDIAVIKSRGEGMSWISCLFALRDWLFLKESKVGLVSSDEKKSDNPGNLDSLMAKLDWELLRLPVWMTGVADKDWKRNLSEHYLWNLENGSQITAFAATGDLGRGGRYRWFLMDELAFWDRGPDDRAMASTGGATECRLIVSTPQGSDGAYYKFIQTPSNALQLKLDWKENPSRNRGLYRVVAGKIVQLDPINNPLPPGYEEEAREIFARIKLKGFVVEGTIRSPWYDRQCDKGDATVKSIAQEYDMDFGGSSHRVFLADFTAVAEKSVTPPYMAGNLDYHPETLKLDFDRSDDHRHAPAKLWCQLDFKTKRPPQRPYYMGIDCGTGAGGSFTSNSAIVVFDGVTNEQVFEFASNTIEPADFADLAVAVGRWFWDAYMIPEINGPGKPFIKRVLKHRYQNLYFREQLWKRKKTKTKEPGFWTDKNTKRAIFSEFGRSVRAREVVLRSDNVLKECREYIWKNGSIEHVLSLSTDDDSSTGEAHGDRVIAACCAVWGMRDRPITSAAAQKVLKPSPYTLAGRHQTNEEEVEDVWDDRTGADLLRTSSWPSRSY